MVGKDLKRKQFIFGGECGGAFIIRQRLSLCGGVPSHGCPSLGQASCLDAPGPQRDQGPPCHLLGTCDPARLPREPTGTGGVGFGGLGTWKFFFFNSIEIAGFFSSNKVKKKVLQTHVCKHDLKEHLWIQSQAAKRKNPHSRFAKSISETLACPRADVRAQLSQALGFTSRRTFVLVAVTQSGSQHCLQASHPAHCHGCFLDISIDQHPPRSRAAPRISHPFSRATISKEESPHLQRLVVFFCLLLQVGQYWFSNGIFVIGDQFTMLKSQHLYLLPLPCSLHHLKTSLAII